MPTREEIKRQVIPVLANMSGFSENRIEEPDRLEAKLGLTAQMRGALAPDFADIARKYNPAAEVAQAECKSLDTVKSAVDLVYERSVAG